MSNWSYEHPYLTFIIIVLSLTIINNAVNVIRRTPTTDEKKNDEKTEDQIE